MDPINRKYRKGKVVMFHHGRCGSTVVGKMLNDHPEIYWPGELLHERHVQKKVNKGTFDYRREMAAHEYLSGRGYFGFEIKYPQFGRLNINQSAFLDRLEDLQYTHYILLERHNHLRQIVSRLAGAQRGFYNVRVGSPLAICRIQISPEDVLAQLAREAEHTMKIRSLIGHKNPLLLFYEEHIQNDPYVAYRKVCEFLDVVPVPAVPKLQRANPFPLSDIIVNFSEIQEVLRDTAHAWMLES